MRPRERQREKERGDRARRLIRTRLDIENKTGRLLNEDMVNRHHVHVVPQQNPGLVGLFIQCISTLHFNHLVSCHSSSADDSSALISFWL